MALLKWRLPSKPLFSLFFINYLFAIKYYHSSVTQQSQVTGHRPFHDFISAFIQPNCVRHTWYSAIFLYISFSHNPVAFAIIFIRFFSPTTTNSTPEKQQIRVIHSCPCPVAPTTWQPRSSRPSPACRRSTRARSTASLP
ncbi:unnamed protein product, partial [Ascophyllum nodosum]